jgi:hypothetical protein
MSSAESCRRRRSLASLPPTALATTNEKMYFGVVWITI